MDQNRYGFQDGAGLLLRGVGLRKNDSESLREDGGTTLQAMILFGQNGEESGHTEKVWVSKGEVGKAMSKGRQWCHHCREAAKTDGG